MVIEVGASKTLNFIKRLLLIVGGNDRHPFLYIGKNRRIRLSAQTSEKV